MSFNDDINVERNLSSAELFFVGKTLTKWIELEYLIATVDKRFPHESIEETNDIGEMFFHNQDDSKRGLSPKAEFWDKLSMNLDDDFFILGSLGYDHIHKEFLVNENKSLSFPVSLMDPVSETIWKRVFVLESIYYQDIKVSTFLNPNEGPWWTLVRSWATRVNALVDHKFAIQENVYLKALEKEAKSSVQNKEETPSDDREFLKQNLRDQIKRKRG